MEIKGSWRKPALSVSQFLTSEVISLRQLGTERICEKLRTSPAFHRYEMKDSPSLELFVHLFHNRNFPGTLLHGAQVF